MKFNKFQAAVINAQSAAKQQSIFTAIVPAFNAVHTAKTPSDLREWLQCYSKDVTVILFTPALATSEARAMQLFFKDTWEEIVKAESNLLT